MQKWEYKIVSISSYLWRDSASDDLTKLGKKGWELVNICEDDGSFYAVFKRPLEG